MSADAPLMPPAAKVPAAVVYLERPDGRVLALTRGQDFADWHLPGGKWEPQDGTEGHDAPYGERPTLRTTAVREVSEETGIRLDPRSLRGLMNYETRSGRPVRLYMATPPAWCPDRFPPYPAGQPAWVPPSMLVLPSCTFAPEAAGVLRAVAAERQRGQPSPFPAQAAAERMVYEDGGGR